MASVWRCFYLVDMEPKSLIRSQQFESFIDSLTSENFALRERVKELEECLKAVLEINKAHKFNGHLVNDRIELLINKGK